MPSEMRNRPTALLAAKTYGKGFLNPPLLSVFARVRAPTYAHRRRHFCGDPRSCQTWQSWEPYRNFAPSNLSVVLVKIVVRILSLSDFENSRWSEHPLKGQP